MAVTFSNLNLINNISCRRKRNCESNLAPPTTKEIQIYWYLILIIKNIHYGTNIIVFLFKKKKKSNHLNCEKDFLLEHYYTLVEIPFVCSSRFINGLT